MFLFRTAIMRAVSSLTAVLSSSDSSAGEAAKWDEDWSFSSGC
eukprot:XP_001709791.1 Hypothetical protein GL50803_37022 [Giardia lamblia ATCC 50803]